MKKFILNLCIPAILILSALPVYSGSIEGQLAGKIDIVVSQDNTGDFITLMDAINAVPDNSAETTVIFIRNGMYYEKIEVPPTKTNLTLIGEDVDSVIVYYDDNGHEVGSWGSVSFQADANNFTAINITFANSYDGKDIWNLAFCSFGDKQLFYHCRFLAWQDTYYLNWRARSYLKDCFIEGAVDYIYGYGIGVLDSCQIHTVRSGGVITASAASEYNDFGLTFKDCRLTSPNGISGVYLGRPWQSKPHVAYLNCYESAAIASAGWTNMSSGKNPIFAEYNCTGPGFQPDKRSTNTDYPGIQLTEQQAQNYLDLSKVFSAESFASAEESDFEITEMRTPFDEADITDLIMMVMKSGRDTFPDIPADDWLPDLEGNELIQVVKANFKPFLDSSYMTDPEIENITIDGNPLEGFDAGTTDYGIEVVDGDTIPPSIEVTVINGYYEVKYPSELPGYTTVEVYSKDYTKQTNYKIFNSIDSAYWDADLVFLGFNRTDTIELQEGVYEYDVTLDESVDKISSIQYTKSYTGASARRYLPTEIPGTGTVEITSLGKTVENTYSINYSYTTGSKYFTTIYLNNNFEILNPVTEHGYLKISEPADGILNLNIYDITGARIHSRSIERNSSDNLLTVDFTSLNQGIYLYQINEGRETYSGKFIKLGSY